MNLMKVSDVFNTSDKGIFTSIETAYGANVPSWLSENKEILNGLYLNHSCDRYLNSYISLLKQTSEHDYLNSIGQYIVTFLKMKWARLWELENAEYNPLNNYDMSETETTVGHDVSSGESTASGTGTGSGVNSVYGFNSTTAQPSESNTSSSTNAQTGESENTSDRNETKTHVRSGNIGVMSSQDLIEQSRALENWQFFEQVFKDIDNLITLSIY